MVRGPRRRTNGRETRHNLNPRSKCCFSHPTLGRSKPHYSINLHSTPHTSFRDLCDPSHFAATHGCRTVQQALSTSKELTWTQMATLKPREISRFGVNMRKELGTVFHNGGSHESVTIKYPCPRPGKSSTIMMSQDRSN
uniref:Uncharacterized protein n=1 Tax=Oryza barthii TaxID=65489 RepID=A0A0D3HSK4_9ORYZ